MLKTLLIARFQHTFILLEMLVYLPIGKTIGELDNW